MRPITPIANDDGNNKCWFCNEELKPSDSVAEMYDPNDKNEDAPSVLCHYEPCGVGNGYELA